jgi:hypothetical protein
MRSGRGGGGDSGETEDIPEAEALQIGQLQAAFRPGNMQQGVGIAVAITGSIRQGADADAIEDDEDDALNGLGLKRHQLSRKIRRKKRDADKVHQLR